MADADALANIVVKFRRLELSRQSQYETLPFAAKHRKLIVGVIDEPAYLGDRPEAAPEQDRHDRNLPVLRVRLDLGKSRKHAITVPKRKGMERLVLCHGLVGDAVHPVDVLTVEIDVRLVHLPSVVFLHHRHPLAVRRDRHAARVDLAGVQERVATVQLLRHHHGFADESTRVRMHVVVPANGWRPRPVRRTGIFDDQRRSGTTLHDYCSRRALFEAYRGQSWLTSTPSLSINASCSPQSLSVAFRTTAFATTATARNFRSERSNLFSGSSSKPPHRPRKASPQPFAPDPPDTGS